MSPIQSLPNLSLTEFLQLPETKPASEYINGQIYSKPMPKGKHSRLQTYLAAEINRISEPQQLACAFTELRCTFGGQSIVPDIFVFSWSRIPLDEAGEIENTFGISPDWTIEILSPEQSSVRVIDNILFCLNHGTELGWLIDPQERLVVVFRPGQQPEVKQSEDEISVLSLPNNFQISVSGIFGWLSLN